MADTGRLTALADRALLPLGLFFLACGFVVAPEPVWAAMFYLVGVPLVLWRVLPVSGPALLGDPLVALPAALVLWLALALLWSGPAQDGPSRWLWLWNCFCTLGFFLAIVHLAQPARGGRLIVTALIAAGAANALWAIGRFVAGGGAEGRMPGWAETRQPILGALIIGLVLIAALGRLPRSRGGARLALVVAVVAMAVFIWLSGSRGPLAAAAAGAAVLLAGVGRGRVLAAGAAAVAAVALVVLVAPSLAADLLTHLSERGWSQRLGIWQQSAGLIEARPLFGYGLTALLPRPVDRFPHSLYLSTWYYGGAVGLATLLASGLAVARGLWRVRPATAEVKWERLTLAGFGVCIAVGGLTDLAQVVKGPGPMWYIVWLPLALAIAFIRRERAR